MKKVVLGLIIIFCWSCQNENDPIVQETSKEVFVAYSGGESISKGPSGRLCRFNFEYGDEVCINGICECDESNSMICGINMQCYPDPTIGINLPPVLWDPCKIIPCGWNYNDPWIIYDKIDPRKFGSIRDYLQVEVQQPSATAFPFVMNKEVLGLQFYQPNNLMSINAVGLGDPSPQPSIYHLKNTIKLDPKLSQELGLQSNIIKPGEYPVVFNPKNKTYNVLLKVQ